MAHVMDGAPIWPLRVGAPIERLAYRAAGVDPAVEMDWKRYAIALLLFNTVGALVLYGLQRLQLWLPLNPQGFANVSPDSSFNTALSFPFGHAASGSILMRNGKPVGSSLIGQNFSDPKYFWGRPSATSPQPYAGTASSGSNLGPLNPALIDGIKGHIQALRAADPGNSAPIPVDLVTASASGLDPEESIAAALYQAPRVARAAYRCWWCAPWLKLIHKRAGWAPSVNRASTSWP